MGRSMLAESRWLQDLLISLAYPSPISRLGRYPLGLWVANISSNQFWQMHSMTVMRHDGF